MLIFQIESNLLQLHNHANRAFLFLHPERVLGRRIHKLGLIKHYNTGISCLFYRVGYLKKTLYVFKKATYDDSCLNGYRSIHTKQMLFELCFHELIHVYVSDNKIKIKFSFVEIQQWRKILSECRNTFDYF